MLTIPARRVPVAAIATRAVLLRTYTSSIKEGSVAQSREFGKKEKAHEDQYVRKHEEQLLRKLKAQIEEKKKEIDADTKLQAELESKVKESESK